MEVQAEHGSDFARRMFHYYSVLRLHHDLPVFPIVLYLRGGPRSQVADYGEELFGLDLMLYTVALERLPAEEYVGTSPLGAALAALMKKRRDRARLRISMVDRVVRSGLDEALKHLLVNVIETYFVLSEEDAERYRRLLRRKKFRAVQEVELTWADKLMEKGWEKGREAGVIEGRRKTLLRLLAAKFGELSEETTARAEAMSEAELDSTLDRILTATTLDELRLGD